MRGTIFALSSARGRAAVAVIRASGPSADAALEALTGALPEPRTAALRTARDPMTGEAIDQVLALRFAAGASYTGENSFELQCHGGNAVIGGLLRALASLPDMRAAEPGEFTRRALENGRLDAVQAEGLADLVDAETEAQRRQALRVMRGALSEHAARWREALVTVRALLEASIDFADEEDAPDDVSSEVRLLLESAARSMRAELRGADAAERIRDGFEVALVGPPNAGKSTLLNALARRDAALTSEIAGTTRDVIEVHLDLRGLPVTLLDTAGLRETEDQLEAMGVDRARKRSAEADLRVVLRPPGEEAPEMLAADDVLVASKADLGHGGAGAPVSAETGGGVEALVGLIAERLEARAAGASAVIRLRHRDALEGALGRIAAAEGLLEQGAGAFDLAAEELRLAASAMEVLVGRVDAEDLLNDIFARFCLGK